MTILTCTKERNNVLNEELDSFQSSVRWQEEFKNEKVKEITKSFVDITEQLFNFLRKKNCKIINQEEITGFLKRNVNLAEYLFEAPFRISEEFGKKVALNLELSFDPEYADDEGELFLNIETDLSVRDSNEKLDAIDRNWFLRKVGKDIGKFNLNLDFV